MGSELFELALFEVGLKIPEKSDLAKSRLNTKNCDITTSSHLSHND